jgi:hypothetical protein
VLADSQHVYAIVNNFIRTLQEKYKGTLAYLQLVASRVSDGFANWQREEASSHFHFEQVGWKKQLHSTCE